MADRKDQGVSPLISTFGRSLALGVGSVRLTLTQRDCEAVTQPILVESAGDEIWHKSWRTRRAV